MVNTPFFASRYAPDKLRNLKKLSPSSSEEMERREKSLLDAKARCKLAEMEAEFDFIEGRGITSLFELAYFSLVRCRLKQL